MIGATRADTMGKFNMINQFMGEMSLLDAKLYSGEITHQEYQAAVIHLQKHVDSFVFIDESVKAKYFPVFSNVIHLSSISAKDKK